jgi:protein-S-isoprenylcysteine O-methyltransferase Ste14
MTLLTVNTSAYETPGNAKDNGQGSPAAEADDSHAVACWSKAPVSWARFRSPQTHNAGVLVRPVPMFIGVWLAIIGLSWFFPLPLFAQPVPLWLSLVVRLGGIAFGVWGLLALRRARTNICPLKSTAAILTTGPYRLSRNPAYTGFSIALVGVALVWNSLWGALLLIPLLITLHYGVILREERYLESKFGEEYRQYCSRVRRYL